MKGVRVFGRPFVKRFAPLQSVRCLSDETWHTGRSRPWPHCVRWGPSSPSPKGTAPNFQPISVTAKWLHGSRCHYGCRPRPRRLCVRWGPRSLSPKGSGASVQFSAHVYCGQTAGWIKMVLGMEVGLSPGDFVLDGDPAPFPQKGAESPPNFLLWPNGWMHQDATWYGCRSQTRGTLC